MKRSQCEAVSLRYVHDVVTGDFISIGVILYSREAHFLGARFAASMERVMAAFPGADWVHLKRICAGVQEACEEWNERLSTELAMMLPVSISELVAHLVPIEDASLQFSPVISGITSDAERTLSELFDRYVGKPSERKEREGRTEAEVWRSFTGILPDPRLVKRLQPKLVVVPHYQFEFRHAWKNGTWHAVQPLSFDLMDAQDIREKAVTWSGRIGMLKPREQDLEVKMLVAVPPRDRPRKLHDAARDALAILSEQLKGEAEVVPESDARRIARQIVADLEAHSDV